MYKKLGVLAVVAVVGFWFWVIANQWVHSDIKFALVSAWAGPLAAIVVASAVIAVAQLVLPNGKWRWLTALCVALTMLTVFDFTWLNGVGALAVVLLTVWAGKLIGIEARDRTKLHIFLIMRRGLSFVILPLLIAISFQYYQSPALMRRAEKTTTSLQPSFQEVMNFTVQTFFKSQGEQLTESQEKEYEGQATRRILDVISHYARKYAPFLPPIFAFGLFIVLWGLAYMFIYLSVLLGMLLFLVLRKTGFVKIEIVQMPSEFIKI